MPCPPSSTGRPGRAHFLLEQLLEHARQNSDLPFSANTGYVNTIEPTRKRAAPATSRSKAPARLHALERHGHGGAANRLHPADGDLGGHIGSFASLASMFGAGFNHFWHAESENHGGDLLYIQGHSAPGIYARAYLEGRLTEEQLDNFRQEVDGKGLSSYPHPKLMPTSGSSPPCRWAWAR
jgi:pyruvate dehydrogenase E1 component